MERDANLLGALSLAVGGRILAGPVAARLGPSGATALVALAGWLEGGSIEDLSGVLGLTHSGTVRLVDRLEQEGLVRRRPGPDGRTLALGVTADGERAAERVRAERALALEDVLAPLDGFQRATFAEMLAALLAGLTDSRATARRVCRLCDAAACGHHDGRCPVTNAADAATR